MLKLEDGPMATTSAENIAADAPGVSAYSIAQRLAAEFVGTFFLLAIVIGSGIMGDSLAGGNDAIALLGNTLATGAGLVVLITMFGPVSGAHFNPAVTLSFLVRKEITVPLALAFVGVQIIGGILGVWSAHLMFEESLFQISAKARDGAAQVFSESVATFGLVAAILAGVRLRPEAVPWLVGLFITAAYWFTASTSFANPAVTIARGLSDTFAGIAPADILPFIGGQLVGALLATGFCAWLFKEAKP